MINARLKILVWAGFSVLALGVLRLIHLQVFKGNEFARQAFHSHYRRVNIEPRRGAVLDRHGRLLAATVMNDSVYADPVLINDVQKTSETLGDILGTPLSQIQSNLRRQDRRFVWLQRGVTPRQATAIAEANLPGVYFRREARRVYPSSSLFASVLGFTGVDGHGLAGLESSFDSFLSGTAGEDLQAFDALARPYDPDTIPLKEPVQGEDIVLSLDKTIQYFATSALRKMLIEENAGWGAAVVMNAVNGEVLAMVSEPSFNPHRFGQYPAEARRNRCISQVIEPGSTYKSITLAAALENQTIDLTSEIDCQNGEITVENATYSDWKAFSTLTAEDVIVFSSNVGTIKMARDTGARSVLDFSRKIGIGSLRSTEMPGAESGYLKDTGISSKTALASLSIGYGVAVTPLQLAAVYATFANGGYRVQPTLLKNAEQDVPVRVCSQDTAARVKHVLAQSVSRGTGKKARPRGYTAGGKTGTARRYNTETGRYDPDRVTCVFAGFAPVESPVISVCIVIDDPKKNKWASTVSARVFSQIVSRTLLYLGESPERKAAA